MRKGAGWRGQPLAALAAILGGWIALRAAWWLSSLAGLPAQTGGVLSGPANAREAISASPPAAFLSPPPGLLAPRLPAGIGPGPGLEAAPLRPPQSPAAASLSPPPGPLAPRLPAGIGPGPGLEAAPLRPPQSPAAGKGNDRWSADAWLLLRRGTVTAVIPGHGSYGRSQMGGVLRFHLRPESGHRPAAYLRASQALAGARESELALGLAARPLPGLPLAAAAELRLVRSGDTILARPAAYAVSELPPLSLPGGVSAEAYVQAGYAGGHSATAFVDGQIRAERLLLRLGKAELRAGGGAWGGAQEGASRIDAGPGATLTLALGRTFARAALDWRFRLAGKAEPGSGPALTISAGF